MRKPFKKSKPTAAVVAATGEATTNIIAAATGTSAAGEKGNAAGRIEKAMSDAVMKAIADGITDPDHQRSLKMEARERVKRQMADEQAKFMHDSEILDKRGSSNR